MMMMMTNTQELDILYKDEQFIAVNKPSGLLVHRSPIDKREKTFAVQMIRNQINQQVYPVHRLDRPTSGVLLFALNSEIAKKFAHLFQTGQVRKKYIAVVRGYIPEQGTIDHPLKEIKDRYIRRKKDFTEKTYPAITKFNRLATIELPFAVDKYPTSRYSLAELSPKTGRRHQLRRHMKHLSHPIIGDTRHGKDVHNKFFLNQFNCKRLLLAAVEMGFTHPKTGIDVLITASPNRAFTLILERFNWKI
ncbi:MAG: pseudouridylate synthase [Desulfobacteraceae bacterium]|nr:pseudouridylate synthase [Desulfobacteraceae bacterium]